MSTTSATRSAGLGSRLLLVAWLAGITSLLSARAWAAGSDYTTTINPKNVLVEQFEGWGTSLCWWANVLGNATNREPYADLAFKQLQLNIVRYNIGGGENPGLPHSIESRARVPGFEPQPGVWDWNADANQRWFLRAAVARGVNRVVAFANSPPYWMTVSGSVSGATNGANDNLRVEYETAFADYLVTVVSNLTRLDGVHFDTLTPMNEPGSDWWYYGNRQEGTHMSHAQQARLLQLLRPALARNGLQTGLVASEDNDEQRTINAVKSYDPATQKMLSQIVTHTYTANNPTGIRELAKALDKPVWISEYGDGEASGLRMARRIRNDIVETHARAWIYWQFAEPDSNWGLIRYHHGETNPIFSLNKKFYVFSQFSNFIRPGFQILDTEDKNSLVAYDPIQHRLVLVTINDNKQSFTATFDLTSFRTQGASVTSYRTSSTENMRETSSEFFREGKLSTVMPSRSITTQVITNIFPSEQNFKKLKPR